MHNYGDDKLVFSASDLANASECLWAQVRRIDKALGFDIKVPKEDDVMLKRAGKLGDVHEQKQLAHFKAVFGDGVVEIPRPDYEDKSKPIESQMLELSARTVEALESNSPVVFQATFFDGEFQGFADFIVRTESGEYVVYDTKLARRAKITALIQLAAYAHQLQLNGIPTSKQVHLILGDLNRSTHNLEDILPTYLKRRSDMSLLIESRKTNRASGGPAVEWNDSAYRACGKCAVCEPNVEANDDLLLIAGMRQDQRAKLRAAGIKTATELALTELDTITDLSPKTYTNLRAQAKIQHKTKLQAEGNAPAYDVVKPHALSALPSPNDGDIFFDFEGDPLYQEGTVWNLDYLFGYVDVNKTFVPIYAHNLQQERLALIEFVKQVRERLKKYPGMHIYHYAAYEKTHLLSLAARHGVEEDFIDDLLRQNILVDLYPIVRKAVLVGSHSYSLKKLEPIFVKDEVRGAVANAADSVAEYALYCQLVANGETEAAAAKLKDIGDYNAYDCRSTLALRDWLIRLAQKHQVPTLGSSFETPAADEDTSPLYQELMRFIAEVPLAERSSEDQAVALAAAAIDFHRRENNSFWWAHFDRLVSPIEEWQDSKGVFVVEKCQVYEQWSSLGDDSPTRRKLLVNVRPAPGSRATVGDTVFLLYDFEAGSLPESESPIARRTSLGKISEVLEDNIFVISEGLGEHVSEHGEFPEAITPGFPPDTTKVAAAIKEWGQNLLEAYPAFPQVAALDILRRKPPFDEPLVSLGENTAEQITETLLRLNHSYVAVQGPPGAGKSHNGGKIIADLVLNHGWKVGVIGQSHSTIENLLRSVSKAGVPQELVGKAVKNGQKVGDLKELASTTWKAFSKKSYAGFIKKLDAYVVGGTVWDFVSEDQIGRNSLDLLVIDEAGQYSLANTIAASVSAKNLLLLGDPQQLPQVTQGTHPEPIDGSALGWLAGDDEVISSLYGYFLPSSYRMNREVCQVVSSNWYDSKLASSAPNRKLDGIEPGFHKVPVMHSSNSTESVEEAERVVELVRTVIDKQWTDQDGTTKTLAEAKENVIVVAPYNAQVNLIRSRLDAAGFGDIPVGTVDKFQGQEAAIAIVSLTASAAEDVPRGIEFLLIPNRLNVAISRAKWAAYLVYSPALLDYRPTNVENLRLLSKFINLVNA